MSTSAISIQHLSKQYRLGVINYGRLTRDLQSFWARLRGREDPNSKVELGGLSGSSEGQDRFWALRDVNLNVKSGERLGIVGQNGAGKSTLLKILSKVTAPTEGLIKLRGQVASLLEVGTGFNPELTGRENVFLNGAILGMRKAEIRKKLDEIVSFAEIERFIDTPVKRYSSGMYVRLAFAVAAHLEPDILLVDEVLAVGDIAFQKKCLGKMEAVSKTEGRTILFVSHNMQAIRSICDRAILLTSGQVSCEGNTTEVLSAYSDALRSVKVNETSLVDDTSRRRGSGHLRIASVSIEDPEGKARFHFEMGETIQVGVSYKIFKDVTGCALLVGLRSGVTNEIVTTVRHILTTDRLRKGSSGTAKIRLPNLYIRPGEYPLYFHLSEAHLGSKKIDVVDDAIHPLVISAGGMKLFDNYEPENSVGYFSIPSTLVANRIIAR
jgi:lipopolysaccharide transport system ATP-binding protein